MAGQSVTGQVFGPVVATFVLQLNLTPASVGATTIATQTFTVPGLLVGDQASDFSFQGTWAVNVAVQNFWISANNTLSVTYNNQTAGALSPPAGTYYLEVNRLGIPAPYPSAVQ